ncbi:hypothetical protein JCM19039_362 [Geomicrobium sp. JCM 19039]|nr:hypothetical protein JCM19039_362 [Geomicrobium sp. JCM 19039]
MEIQTQLLHQKDQSNVLNPVQEDCFGKYKEHLSLVDTNYDWASLYTFPVLLYLFTGLIGLK